MRPWIERLSIYMPKKALSFYYAGDSYVVEKGTSKRKRIMTKWARRLFLLSFGPLLDRRSIPFVATRTRCRGLIMESARWSNLSLSMQIRIGVRQGLRMDLKGREKQLKIETLACLSFSTNGEGDKRRDSAQGQKVSFQVLSFSFCATFYTSGI